MAKGVKHYSKDGTVYKGKMHKHSNGTLMTGKVMSNTSKKLYHYAQLSPNARKKAKISRSK